MIILCYYVQDCKFQSADTVRVEKVENAGIPIENRIGTVESVKITERDYNLVTFRYNDGDEVMLENFNNKWKIDDRYTGNVLTLLGNLTVVKIKSFTRYHRHVMVKEPRHRTGT